MTVQTNNNSISYVGNGSTVHFDYDYLILNASHLKVYFGDVLQTSGYVVSGVSSQTGGTVAFAVAPPNGTNITLIRDVPFLQLTDYQPYDAFPAESHERALDLLTMMAQQLKDASDRSMPYPVGGNKWDAKGNEIINVGTGSSGTSAANINQVKYLIASEVGDDPSASASVRSREALRRSYAEAGYNLVGGSFEAGGTLVNTNDVLLYEAKGEAYSYLGVISTGGHVVVPGTNPVGDSNWAPRTDESLRSELIATGGPITIFPRCFQSTGDLIGFDWGELNPIGTFAITEDRGLFTINNPTEVPINNLNAIGIAGGLYSALLVSHSGTVTTEQLGFSSDGVTDETTNLNTVAATGLYKRIIVNSATVINHAAVAVTDTIIELNRTNIVTNRDSAFLQQRRNELIRVGHRGSGSFFPEHTPVAYVNSLAYGICDAIEPDLQESADGTLWVFHDKTVDRTTDGTGMVSSLTDAYISSLDAGSWFAAGYARTKPLKFIEACSLMQGSGVHSFWPQANGNVLSTSELRIERYLKIIDAVKEYGLEDITYIQEFDVHLGYGDEIRQVSKTVKIAAIFGGSAVQWALNLEWAKQDGNTTLLTNYDFLIANPTLVADALSQGVDVAAFTVDSQDDSDALRKIGVNIQFSNISLRKTGR